MKKQKIPHLMIVTFSLILIMSGMSVKTGSAPLHISNALKSAEIDTLENNLKNDITYNTSVFVSENSTEFLLGYSDLSETNIVVDWVTDNLNAEIVAISNYTSLIHFKTNETKGFEVQSLINTQQDFGVRYIQDHIEIVPCDTWDPNDYYLEAQWYLNNIKAKEAWFYERGDPDVWVSVLDSGCDMDHPDLADNLITDWDWDFADKDGNPQCLDSPGADVINAHGTNCAGVIAAVQNNTIGIAGIANVKIINLRIYYYDEGGFHFSFASLIDAIYWAVWYTDIISCSFIVPGYNQEFKDACDYAWEQGVLIVASAGNDGWDLDNVHLNRYPAEWDSVMCVAATDNYDNRAHFGPYASSNYGDETVDICAPGTRMGILTTNWSGEYTNNFGKTSASAAIVAGVAALIKSHYPSYSLTDLWNALVDGADDVGDQKIGGRVNALNSVTLDYIPSSYQNTPGALVTGSYHSGALSNLKKVDSTYFSWRTSSIRIGPFWVYGFSVDFYFPDLYMSRLKIDLSFGGQSCTVDIHWASGGSDYQTFSQSLDYDCNSKRIHHITIWYCDNTPCPLYVYFDRIILVGTYRG